MSRHFVKCWERLTRPSDNVGVDVGRRLIPSKHSFPTSTQHFYCSHRVESLSCSFDRVTWQKPVWACVLWRIVPLKVFKTRLHCFPGLMQSECRQNVGTVNTQNWPTVGLTNVWWMMGEISRHSQELNKKGQNLFSFAIDLRSVAWQERGRPVSRRDVRRWNSCFYSSIKWIL